MIGPESAAPSPAACSAPNVGLPHELLDASEIARRFPTLSPGREDVGLYEQHAGFVRPEATVAAHIGLACARGAELHFDETVTGWESRPGGVVVTTPLGSYRAARLVLSPGAWAPQLFDGFGIPLRVERLVQFWLRPEITVEQFAPSRQPIYVWEDAAGAQVYGFPARDSGRWCEGRLLPPERRGGGRRAHTRGSRPGSRAAARLPRPPHPGAWPRGMPSGALHVHHDAGRALRPRLPCGEESVVVCSPCSGHGFKFVPVIGEVVADLVTSGSTRFDISLFDPARFAKTLGAANALRTDGGRP